MKNKVKIVQCLCGIDLALLFLQEWLISGAMVVAESRTASFFMLNY